MSGNLVDYSNLNYIAGKRNETNLDILKVNDEAIYKRLYDYVLQNRETITKDFSEEYMKSIKQTKFCQQLISNGMTKHDAETAQMALSCHIIYNLFIFKLNV